VSEFKFEIERTFRVPTFAVVDCKLVRVREFKFEIERTFRVPTFAVVDCKLVRVREFTFEIEMTFRVPTLTVGVMRDATFAVDDTLREVSVPTEVMFGWAG
jgi:hypothetical protein